jgi:hypothetical protein
MFELLFVLVVLGVIWYFVDRFIPMHPTMKTIITVVVVVGVIGYLLKLIGINIPLHF